MSESFQGAIDESRQNLTIPDCELTTIKRLFRDAISSVINQYFPQIADANHAKFIISNFESIKMNKFESMIKKMTKRIYHIEIQCIKENWERSADCSQFLILAAPNFENSEKIPLQI